MKKEIERRFLVNEGKLPVLTHGKLITQGYLAELENGKSPIVRVRTENKKAYLTIKLFRSELTKEEFEYSLPLKEAQKLLDACLATVQKIRYFATINQHSWSIDVYEGENYPLVVAEIELKSEIEKFDRPLWVSKEVSADPAFQAYSLAFKPFSSWKRTR